MNQFEPRSAAAFRALLVLAGAVLLLLWGWSLVPAVRAWNDPRADGFELLPAFWATVTALPLGLVMLAGGVTGSEKGMRRGRSALIITGWLFVLLLLLEGVRRLSILMED